MQHDTLSAADAHALNRAVNGPAAGIKPPATIVPPHLLELREALRAAWLPILDAAHLGQDLPKGAACLERLAHALRPYTAEPWCPESLESGDHA